MISKSICALVLLAGGLGGCAPAFRPSAFEGGALEQWMYLQPDGRTVMNEATVRVFGVVVAHLSERITQESH
jgi:hypothetical protein